MATQLQEFVRQTIDELLQELPPEKRMEGLSPKDRVKGLSLEQRLEGLSAEEKRAALDALRRELGQNDGNAERN